MDLEKHWAMICDLFHRAFLSSLHFAVATVGEDGSPYVTPIGSLFLREDNSGFFFDEKLRNMSRNLQVDQRICVLALESSKMFWIKSLLMGEFSAPPGVRLRGRVGGRRKATDEEIALMRRRVRFYRFFRGYNLSPLWLKYGRTFSTTVHARTTSGWHCWLVQQCLRLSCGSGTELAPQST